jgi:protein subunit release factor B
MNHTPVTQAKLDALKAKMTELGIAESDIAENFTRSGGAGGQHVNKTSSCVALKHVPSGIEVKCSESRSQSLNRFLAKRRLIEKIEEQVLQKKSARQQEIEKLRRQKRKRSKRAKDKMLDGKRMHAEKKASRRIAE